ncbi:MAG: ribosome silencing factor [Halanaerobiaceae bacterium]
MSDEIKEITVMAADAADDKKAFDIEILEVTELTVIADYFLICSGKSEVQVQAIAREIEEKLSEINIEPQKIAGAREGRWILMDYGDLIVHIFHRQEREYYQLERLWADAEKILLESERE